MTLEEAIKHCEEVAEEERSMCVPGCDKCADEHLQLAEWLKELKAYKDMPKGELISREDLKKLVISQTSIAEVWENTKILSKVLDIIDNAPAVEAYTKEDMRKEYQRGITDAYRDNPPI